MEVKFEDMREERDSLKLVVSLLGKDLYTSLKSDKEKASVEPSPMAAAPLPNNNSNIGKQSADGTGKSKKSRSIASKRRSANTQPARSDSAGEGTPTSIGSGENQSEEMAMQRRQNVVIAGDSIINFVKGRELSDASKRVTVKSFSGATVEDMHDYVKPILKKNPDTLVLHIGTNDLRNSEPQEVANAITDLARKIETEATHEVNIAVSGLTTRSDSSDLANRVRGSFSRAGELWTQVTKKLPFLVLVHILENIPYTNRHC
ncbi:uncharacterized protein LOC125559126 [Nematostella vectensis]|uniref:uncharacterized protein LOC125559126 n=1 Tax=Nematostella vectensis TaxID=45351 RepID=UPI00207757B2|nr:uncharacterized protein LOC125559126 [Nematostella vectensis]